MVSPSALRAKVREHVGVPGPLLEHLARRLDEVPLGRDAGEAHPLGAAGEDVVHEVAELVEERHDLVVLHAGPRLKLQTSTPSAQLRAGDAADEVELRRVLVLAVARVQVEVDAADALARGTRRRRSRPPRATCGRPRRDRRPLSPKSRPVTSSSPWRTDSKGKYVRTRWASTASCSLRTSSA